jgi:hypothetical protein
MMKNIMAEKQPVIKAMFDEKRAVSKMRYAKLLALGRIARFEIEKVVEAITCENRKDERRHYACYQRADDARKKYLFDMKMAGIEL